MTAQIIIIGAGIAGLAAANALSEAGYQPLILEARHRIGGRIKIDDSWGFPLSQGAHWLHGKQTPMHKIAHQVGSQLTEYAGQSSIYMPTGEKIPPNKIDAFYETINAALQKAKHFAEQQPHDCSLKEALSHVWSPDLSDPYTAVLFKKKLRFFENYIGASYDKLSARHWDMAGSLPEENYIIKDGYASILNHLAKDCHIQLNTQVTHIDYQNDMIKLQTTAGEYQANHIIITIPISLFKANTITFAPELPAAKKRAIAAIGMGLFNILGLYFSHTFWPENADSFFIGDNQKNNFKGFYNLFPVVNKPILYGYAGGETALALEKMSDEVIIENMRETLSLAFNMPIPHPKHYFMTRWHQDPYSLGSYSYVPVNATADDFIALAEPIADKLFFAGEATNAHIYDATVHSAYLSGIREANHIIRLANSSANSSHKGHS